MTPNIFIFTAGNPEAQQNLADSIESPIRPEEKVFGSFAFGYREELENVRKESDGFYAWGAVPGLRNIPNWKTVKRGDYVLGVYDNTYHYVARVLAKYHNQSFARRVWGEDADGKTWEYMYFLTKPIEVNQPLYEFEGYLHSGYQGFTKISDERISEIEEDFGSIEGFVQEILEYEGGGLPNELMLAPNRSEEVAEISLQVDDVAHGTVDETMIPDSEGRERIVQHVAYERSRKNRELAIKIHGTKCEVCGFSFDKVYGRDYADSYIEIHHVRPLSKHEGEVDPARDLRPLWAKCHRMAHKRRTSVTSIDELKALIKKANSNSGSS